MAEKEPTITEKRTPPPPDGPPAHDNHGDEHHDHGGLGKYIQVTVCLLILTAISFGIGNSFLMNTPSIAWIGMMGVSCAKAMLVILFFMHLKYEANWKYVLTIPASMMSIFLLLMLVPDIGLRTRWYSEPRWIHAAEPRVEHESGSPDSDDHGTGSENTEDEKLDPETE